MLAVGAGLTGIALAGMMIWALLEVRRVDVVIDEVDERLASRDRRRENNEPEPPEASESAADAEGAAAEEGAGDEDGAAQESAADEEGAGGDAAGDEDEEHAGA